MDLSLHRRHLPAFGRSIFGGIEPYDRRHGSDARGYPDVYVRQSGRNGNLLPSVVPYEVPFYQQDTAYVRCTGSATLQPDSAAHHFPSAVVADMLHRRNVQDSGNFRMYVQHSVMDDAQA